MQRRVNVVAENGSKGFYFARKRTILAVDLYSTWHVYEVHDVEFVPERQEVLLHTEHKFSYHHGVMPYFENEMATITNALMLQE